MDNENLSREEEEVHSTGNNRERVKEWVDSGYMSNSDVAAKGDSYESVFFDSSDGRKVSFDEQERPAVANRVLPENKRKRSGTLWGLKNKHHSFNSDISGVSTISSIESLLEARRENPEQLLFSLGFGFVRNEHPSNRIPNRFLEKPSQALGIDPKSLLHNDSCPSASPESHNAFSGSIDFYREKVGSLERFLNHVAADKNNNDETFEGRQRRVSSIRDAPEPRTSIVESILTEANREFLDNQGKEECNHLFKKLILGTKTYSFDVNGDPFVPLKSPIPSPKYSDESSVNSVLEGAVESLSREMDPEAYSPKGNLLTVSNKRRPLVRQRRVSEELETALPCLHIRDNQKTAMSSHLSSSSGTLVGTVISVTDSCDVLPVNQPIDCDNSFDSTPLTGPNTRSIGCQVEDAIEKSSIDHSLASVAIHSLQLALEFYRNHSLKLANVTMERVGRSRQLLTREDVEAVRTVNQLREKAHSELKKLEALLSRKLEDNKDSNESHADLLREAMTLSEGVRSATSRLIRIRLAAKSLPSLF